MKSIIFSIALSFFGIFISATAPTIEESPWLTNFDIALSKSEKEHLPILMVFSGSDWCRPCIQLDQLVFRDPTFMKYAQENLVLVKLDFPRKKKNLLPEQQQAYNNQLAKQFNQEGQFPLVLLVDHHKNKVASMEGVFDNADQFINKVNQLIANHQDW